MAKKLMLLDAYSLANRAFFALPSLATSTGQPTNAVYGMLMMLLKLLEDAKPDYIVTAFDVSAPTFRHQEYKAYKGQRLKMEDTLKVQIPIIRELLAVLKIPIVEEAGFEADDVIGTLSKQAVKQGIDVAIVTGDRDAFQLVQSGIMVLYTRKGITEVDRVDEAYIQNRYKLTPEQLIELKALMGDASDNIPGVPGFGEKTALKYLYQFHNLDGIYQQLDQITKERDRQILTNFRDQAYLSRHLAEIVTSVPLSFNPEDCCRHLNYAKEELIEFCRKYEFNSMVKKLTDGVEVNETRQLEKLEYQYRILTDGDLEKVKAQITQAKFCSIQFITATVNWDHVTILGFGISDPDNNWFYPLTAGKKMPLPLVEVLEDLTITKYGHDIKRQLQIAESIGISIRGTMEDSLIAGYLVNAGLGSIELEDLAASYLQKDIPSCRNERGKSFSVFNIPNIPENLSDEFLASITGGRIESLLQLQPILNNLISEMKLNSLYWEVELPLIKVLFTMEKEGIKVDPETLREFGRILKQRQVQLEKEIFTLAGEEFNINSPKQLGVILFEKLSLKAPKKTKTGYSTDAEVLENLMDQHPIIPLLLEYRQNTKLQSTYIDSLISLINVQSGRVHTTFNQAITTTGRLSSTEPNLQNIPIRSEEGRLIRRAFIPADTSHRLLAADYSQIELRVMAHFSQDPAFKEAFLKGEDIHKFTAAAVYGVPVEQVTREMRSQAKAVNFGIIYGISGFGLARNIGVSRKEADSFITAYFEKYPGVKEYVEQLIEDAKKTGEARTLMGRIRKLPDLFSRNFTLRSFAERMARNTPIQGTAADIIKKAMVQIEQRLTEKPELGKLLLQVHDELVFEVAEKDWRELARMVKLEMENAVTLSVPLVVDLKLGINWGEMIPVTLEE